MWVKSVGIVLLFLVLLPSIGPANAAPFTLVKGESFDAVYYVDADSVRHPFPNVSTYRSWYGDDFTEVLTISDTLLATYPLGTPIVIRSGNLVKVPSASEVYVTEPGGILRRVDHEDLAAYFFGDSWNTKVIDIPEVFFNTYTIKKPIVSQSDVPDGILYKIAGEDIVYWKNQDVLTRFANSTVLEKNRFDPSTIITTPKPYFTRNHIITDIEPDLFNPVVASNESTADCAAEHLRAGLVYLHTGDAGDEELQHLNTILKDFPAYWHSQSRTFSNIAFPYPMQLISVNADNRKPNESGRYDVTHEIGFEYFETLPDTVDFIIVFTDFPVGESEKAFFSPITQSLDGIGKNRLDRSGIFGSKGKLKGIAVMGSLDNFSFFEQRRIDSLFNSIAHELLHNWSGSLRYRDADGEIRSNLLAKDGIHWSPWASFISPLGGRGWKAVDATTLMTDQVFSQTLAVPFSDLDLYTMGLLPHQVIDPVSFVKTDAEEPSGDTMQGVLETVSIDQIIDAGGQLRCIL